MIILDLQHKVVCLSSFCFLSFASFSHCSFLLHRDTSVNRKQRCEKKRSGAPGTCGSCCCSAAAAACPPPHRAWCPVPHSLPCHSHSPFRCHMGGLLLWEGPGTPSSPPGSTWKPSLCSHMIVFITAFIILNQILSVNGTVPHCELLGSCMKSQGLRHSLNCELLVSKTQPYERSRAL